jgi:hypothetical protein
MIHPKVREVARENAPELEIENCGAIELEPIGSPRPQLDRNRK